MLLEFLMNTPAIWFPSVKTNSGTDSFTEQLVNSLNNQGIRAEITWLPHHTEYLPWFVKKPIQPKWANIAHINTWLPAKFQAKGIPTIATLHHCVQDPSFSNYKSTLQRIYHYLWITHLEKHSIKKASRLTTVSHYTAKCVQEIFGNTEIEVIYNGINQNIFHPNYQKLKTKNKKFTLLFVGNNSIRKGFDLLPKIMEELGDCYELYYTAATPEQLKLPRNMKKLPYQETAFDLAQTYNSMDALIFPSRLEGFGLVVAEAMACGLPVIAANSSALPELIDHQKNGLLCEKDNIQEFIRAIKFIKENPDKAQFFSSQGRLKIQQKFTIDEMVKSYIALYERIILEYQISDRK